MFKKMCKTAVGVMGEHWSQTFSEILGTAFLLKRHKKDQIYTELWDSES